MLLFFRVAILVAADVPEHASLSGKLLGRITNELESTNNMSVLMRRKRRHQTDTRASRPHLPGHGMVHEKKMHGADDASRIRKRYRRRRHKHRNGSTGEGRAPTMLLRRVTPFVPKNSYGQSQSAPSLVTVSRGVAHMWTRTVWS